MRNLTWINTFKNKYILLNGYKNCSIRSVLDMNIWIYWSESILAFIFIYVVLNQNWKIDWIVCTTSDPLIINFLNLNKVIAKKWNLISIRSIFFIMVCVNSVPILNANNKCKLYLMFIQMSQKIQFVSRKGMKSTKT